MPLTQLEANALPPCSLPCGRRRALETIERYAVQATKTSLSSAEAGENSKYNKRELRIKVLTTDKKIEITDS